MPISKRRKDFRFYKIWADMKQRCANPNNSKFALYGGRGILYCYEWMKYENFKVDMYESYLQHSAIHGEKQTTLDRINPNDYYCKENCRWATCKQQRVNIRNKEEYCGYNLITNQFYNFNNCSDFCRQLGFTRQNIQNCIKGKANMHKNCIFARVDGNSHDTYVQLLNKANKLFAKYPKLAEMNKQQRETVNV